VEQKNLLKVKQYRISNEYFEKGYAAGDGPCNCATRCCHGGVWADVQEHATIMAKKELIKQQMDETQTTDDTHWFEPAPVDDADFPSGKAIGTEVFNDKCVFLDKLGRCAIQLAAVADGKHKWEWKPIYCILFPVEISDNLIGFDPMMQDEQSCCSISDKFETPLYLACKDELTHLLGEDGFRSMDEHYASTVKARSNE
jgi:hypothetical protein